jgi:alkylhydroperoxidase family enzyme
MRAMVVQSKVPAPRVEEPPALAALKEMRAAVAAGAHPPAALAAYLEKVRKHAYKVIDEDVTALLAAGITQEQIYEATMYAAMTAGIDRFELGLRALAEVE